MLMPAATNAVSKNPLVLLWGLIVALLLSLPDAASADEPRSRGPRNTAVTGTFDWSIVPANFNLPGIVFPGTDGRFYVRHLPLAGVFRLAGRGVGIDARIHADLSGELDSNFSGVVWAPVTITATGDRLKPIIIFEGRAEADTVALVSVGTMTLYGRGPYEGATLELVFEEIGPGNSDTYNIRGRLKRED
jgi:hypothetical protein